MKTWEIILLVIAVILVLYIAGTLYFFKYIFKPSKKTQPTTKKAMSGVKRVNENEWYDNCKKEHLTITSFDGLTLHADLLINNNNSHNYCILVHGYKSHRRSATLESKIFYDAGCHCLHISNRSHDESGGRFFTMGDFERKDLVLWTKLIVEKDPEAKIILFGRSMGANIVMETVGEELPNNVICGISECGFTSCQDQLHFMTKRYVKIAGIFFLGLKLYCKLFKKFSIAQSAIDQLKKCKIPMLLMHSTKDNFVPVEMLDKVAAACASKKEVVVFEGPGHCEACAVQTEKYKDVINDFINNYFFYKTKPSV